MHGSLRVSEKRLLYYLDLANKNTIKSHKNSKHQTKKYLQHSDIMKCDIVIACEFIVNGRVLKGRTGEENRLKPIGSSHSLSTNTIIHSSAIHSATVVAALRRSSSLKRTLRPFLNQNTKIRDIFAFLLNSSDKSVYLSLLPQI